MANHYDVPSWAGRSPTGHHLDVSKDKNVIQKLLIDDKKCYLFGRNPHLNDFCIDHSSCSRVHAALVYHKLLNISYLVDLGSTHGTFIGTIMIESHKPTQLQINSTFHFGASTRYYTLRERPSAGSKKGNIIEDIPMNESGEGAFFDLPESQTELDNLIEYNTAHNRRISMFGITDDTNAKKNANKPKQERRSVTFNDEEIIINPEDIDPTVGRFRNLIQTTVVPTKRMKFDMHPLSHRALSLAGDNFDAAHLYHDLPPADGYAKSTNCEAAGPYSSDMHLANNMGTQFGIRLPNPAPEVEPTNDVNMSDSTSSLPAGSRAGKHSGVSPTKNSAASADDHQHIEGSDERKKKKYAKEAWPGRKPLFSAF